MILGTATALIKSSGMRQAFRGALSTFDSKNLLLESLDGFRYDESLSGHTATPHTTRYSTTCQLVNDMTTHAALLVWLSIIFATNVYCVTTSHGQDQFHSAIVREMPSHLHRLLDKGSVQFEVNDPLLQSTMRKGITRFEMLAKYQVEYQCESENENGSRWRIAAAFSKSKFEVKHRISFGSYFSLDNEFDRKLLNHEFDHVAISSDPRLEALAKKILFTRYSWVMTSSTGNTPSQAEISTEFEKRFVARKDFIEKIMQRAYLELDEISQDGRVDIAERKKFFDGLYLAPWLKKENDPIWKVAESLVKSKKYPVVDDHYELLDVEP